MFALMPWLRKYRLCGDENVVKVDKFKFSKDGDVYKKFASGRALGMSGKRSLAPVREESTSLERSDDKEEATIASLKEEIERLKEENEQLKETAKHNGTQLTLNIVEDPGEQAAKNEDIHALQHEDSSSLGE